MGASPHFRFINVRHQKHDDDDVAISKLCYVLFCYQNVSEHMYVRSQKHKTIRSKRYRTTKTLPRTHIHLDLKLTYKSSGMKSKKSRFFLHENRQTLALATTPLHHKKTWTKPTYVLQQQQPTKTLNYEASPKKNNTTTTTCLPLGSSNYYS